MAVEKDMSTKFAEHVELYTPLQFLEIMAKFAKDSSTHYQDPDIQSRDAKRHGFAIWAAQYQACIDLIHKLEQEVKDARNQPSTQPPTNPSQV